jgi:hypothetical protein
MHRPTSLVVIASLWMVIGASWVLSGIVFLASELMLSAQIEAAGGPSTLPDPARGVLALGVAGALLQIAAGIAGVTFSGALLRLRAWGRRGLEVLTVLFLVAIAGICADVLFASMHSYDPAFVVGPLLVGTVLLVPLWVVRKHLRGRAIRQAIFLAEQQPA